MCQHCCSTRNRIRGHVLHPSRCSSVRLARVFLGIPQGPSTQRSGMIEQGRLDSVLWFCNTCIVLLSPSGLGFPLVIPVEYYASSTLPLRTRVHCRSHLHFRFMLERRTDVAGMETEPAMLQCSRAACCIDQGHAGATASEWAPLPSNVPFGAGPSASDHLSPKFGRREGEEVTPSPILRRRGTYYRQQAHALVASLP